MSPDLKTLLHESAPEPSDGPHVDDLRRRAGRRRAVRLGSLGAAGVALVIAATAVVMSQPVDLPVPDVINPQPSPDLTPPDVDPVPGTNHPVEPGAVPAEPLLEYVAIRGDTEIIHHTRDGQERTLVEVDDPEHSMWGLDVAIRTDGAGAPALAFGVYVSSIGESDELWWFRAPLGEFGSLVHERLPDAFQRQSTGGVVEIGNPAPAIATAPGGHLIMFVDGQGSGPSPENLTFVNTLHVLELRDDGSRNVHEFPLPDSSGFGWAEFLTVCPEYADDPELFEDFRLCLLTRWPAGLLEHEFSVTADGSVTLEDVRENPYFDGIGDTVASWTFEDGVALWGIQRDTSLAGGSLVLFDILNADRWVELPLTDSERPELTINGEYAAITGTGADRLLVVDLSSGAVAERPPLDSSLSFVSLLWSGGPSPGERAVMAAEWFRRFANDPDRSWARGASAPLAMSVSLALGSDARATLTENDMFDPGQWTIEPAPGELFEGATGPFNALDTLSSATAIDGIVVDPDGHCANPEVRPPPTGLEALTRVRIEGTTGDPDARSCLDWFAVDLFVNDAGEIQGVALQLWEP